MSKPKWKRYSSQDTDLSRAVKICDHLGRVTLLARSRVDGGLQWIYGDFVVGEKHANVCTLDKWSRVEDFEVQ